MTAQPRRTTRSAGAQPAARPVARRLARLPWLIGGLLAVAVGLIGVVLPVIPTTGPFVVAAACFARSSPRLEAWVLGLPGIGPLIADFRDGLGMPQRAKIIAIAMIAVAVTLSAWLGVEAWWARGLVIALGLIGIGYVGWFVPTREHVLARRRGAST